MRTPRTLGTRRTPHPAWRIATALGVTQLVGYGVLFYAYGVVTVPMETTFGWSRAQTSGAFSLALLMSGAAAYPMGRWVDRHGARGLMTAGSVAGAAGIAAWSFVRDLPGLYLVQAAIGLALAAVTYEIAFAVVTRWFRWKRVRALLLVTTLGGLASTVFVPLSTGLVEAVGWRAALRWLAAGLALITVPLHAGVVRRAPDARTRDADAPTPLDATGGEAPEERSVAVRDALRDPRFGWLTTAFSLDRLAVVAIGVHAVPLLLERGHAPALVAAAAGSIGLMQVAGRLAFGAAAEASSLAALAALTYLVRAASLASLLLAPDAVAVWSFAALFGLANGASTLARAGLLAETFGPAHYGAISGSVSAVIALLQTGAPLAVGALRAATGDYRLALLLLAVAGVGAAAAVRRGARAPGGAAPAG